MEALKLSLVAYGITTDQAVITIIDVELVMTGDRRRSGSFFSENIYAGTSYHC
jgi:hypothetical protein